MKKKEVEKKEVEKKGLFGGVNLTWPKLIIGAIVIGVVVGLVNCIRPLLDTSFRDPAIYFGFWIFCGIFIIMNSKSNKDSALKCFIFFLISQPLIYLVEVPFVSMGWGILTYYKFWLIWTILCLPMGFIGYYMKKNKWWSLLILLPMMLIITLELDGFISGLIYYFPHHLISALFCICCLIIYPLFIFDNKKIKHVGLGIGIVLIIISCLLVFIKRDYVYETEFLCDSSEHPLDNTYKVSIKDDKMGKVYLKKNSTSEETFYCVHAEFVKAGKTTIIVESKEGEKRVYNIDVRKNTYDIEEDLPK